MKLPVLGLENDIEWEIGERSCSGILSSAFEPLRERRERETLRQYLIEHEAFLIDPDFDSLH